MLQANQPITNHFLSSLISVTHNTMDLVPEISIFTNITAIRIMEIKLELAKYYKDSEMTAYISERSGNSK